MKTHGSRLIAAFAVIYLVWGSTYLAILVALEAFPPFLLAGSRFLVAGLLLLALARAAGARLPTLRQWAASLPTGAFFFVGGNGLVCWAEQEVASGIAALAIATVPIWMTLIPAPGANRRTVRPSTWAGVVVGLAAVAILALPHGGLEGRIPTLPLLALLLAAACWAAGSHLSLRMPRCDSPFATAGAQMLSGGALAMLVATGAGEWKDLEPAAFSASAVGAWAYLVLFGSVLAVSAYAWLLRETSPAAVGTYAFVNPVVAVLLGWALGGELVGLRTLLSLALVVVSVVLILRGRPAPKPGSGRLGLRAAGLFLVAALLPATGKAGSYWQEKERLAAAAPRDAAATLFALSETAWDAGEDWRMRLCL